MTMPLPQISTLGSPSTLLSRDSGVSLVEQIVHAIQLRIDDKMLRTGARLPSIREFALQHKVSRFTVVEAYERLVATGFLDSRRGAGFFVRERASLVAKSPGHSGAAEPQQMDVAWLIRNIFRQMPAQKVPGSGLLPSDWMDGALIANGLRALSRGNQNQLLSNGTPEGFLPLRQQLQTKLADIDIAAEPGQILLTSGVTQGLDLIARHFLQPGDVVFVDDPAWFLMFGSFATLGAKVIGIPRLQDGPDIEQLAALAALHKPKLFVINSILHNPSSTSLSAAKAFQVLRLAQEHDFYIVEDDIYCDMHPGAGVQAVTRIAALDQLQRVIYLSSFSKILSYSLRVGFIAAAPELIRLLTDRKMLSTLTSPELGERLVHKILSEGHYRKHVDRLRQRLDGVRERTVRHLERIGLRIDIAPVAGMFVWADAGCDTNVLTEKAMAEGYLLAPGSLFSPGQLPSSRMRLNVAAMEEPGIWRFLQREMDQRQ
ncbi:PLP-dependent aminotransferase family protein [Herbaspirillum sp. RTI4]|uniref:aminotransferase-like domain-containing protein n=1 Tax=Herbaspirillum sp. RTI4 TaxID=3048640 RepID=UPI002AB58FE1|nr:PLP-dependent aminotransferase family protein [Herbaspirillum sp. RTI4]MDY7579735.1 PLP-dependent aminotransferase family protein [Herbaspirillum sp. RTI4]MEA9982709.1 PLP-dependent aminotransferase family protein [Herbaspirillum sp. RTI4]